MAQDTTISGFDAALKDVYAGPIRDQLNEKTRLLDLFTKGDIEQYEWEGRQVVLALRKSRNAGIKAVAEGGGLPTAGKQGYANLKIPMTFLEGRIELTAQVMKASRSDKGSFARAMDSEQKGLVEDISRQRNRELAYYGSGTLATVASGATSFTQTVTAPGGVAGTVNTSRFLKVGMMIAFTSPAGVIRTDGIGTIASVTDTGSGSASIVVTGTGSGPATTTADLVSLGANASGTNEGSYQLESMGILGIVDSTTYVSSIFGLDRSNSANAWFRSTVMSSVGALSPDVLQRGVDNAEEVSGEVIDTFISHASVRREYLKLSEADRHYYGSNKPINSDVGTKAGAFKEEVTFDSMPFKVDKDFVYGTLVGVNKGHLFWIPEVEGEWADEDGTVLFRVQNKDNYEARYRLFENFFSDKGNSHVRFDGITATVTAAVFAD
jgi:hypothetical protein